MPERRRIAILGGGVGALTAAYHLTSKPGWQQEYDVTLYQLGWRLGGKGASARNAAAGNRIEEHGLHVWIGNYENAFALMRACYAELQRPPDSPLRTVEDAFTPRTHLTLFEPIDGLWHPWTFHAPTLPGTPGVDPNVPTPWEVLVRVLDVAASLADDVLDGVEEALHPLPHVPEWVHAVAARIGGALDEGARSLVHHAGDLARHAIESGATGDSRVGAAIADLTTGFRAHVQEVIWPRVADHPLLRHACIGIDLAITLVAGIFRDRLLVAGLPSIDDEEFQEWLTRHGAADYAVHSSCVRGLYDLCFAYADGDVTKPCFAAGTALGIMLRVAFSYRGPVLYEMTAGMGEAVVAPIYQALGARGVRFEFFHRVTALEPSADGRSIARIQVGRQVRLKADQYEALIEVGGIACWPDRPLVAQLADEDRQRLEASGANLESAWSGWQDVEARTLEQGRDFDEVVLGISLGGLKTIAAPLAEVSDPWRKLLENIPCIQTQAVQLWLTPRPSTDARGLSNVEGRNHGNTEESSATEPPTTVACAEPLDTWADMSHLLTREEWPSPGPQSLHYICGPMAGDFSRRSVTDSAVPADAVAAVRQAAVDWLTRDEGWHWPAVVDDQTTVFDWTLLYADAALQGEARLDAQYVRANIDPTELYVLSPPKAQQYRLASDQSGFDNLVLAGDWTRTAINAGCVEAAVMSGMAASRALAGVPAIIAGEHFMQG